MALHMCPSQECAARHRQQEIGMWRKEGEPETMYRFTLTQFTDPQVEGMRRYMAASWNCPLEAVEVVWDGYTIDPYNGEHIPNPSYRLAEGWHMTEIIEHPSENITTYARQAVKDD